MTLIVTQFYRINNKYLIINGADSAICNSDGELINDDTKKIFRIDEINASVSFFGDDFVKGAIEDLIDEKYSSIICFARKLKERINDISFILKKNPPTGVHITGIDKNGCPKFYFIRNIKHINTSDNSIKYDTTNLYAKFKITEEFKEYRIDDGKYLTLVNGRLDEYHALWEKKSLKFEHIKNLEARFKKTFEAVRDEMLSHNKCSVAGEITTIIHY